MNYESLSDGGFATGSMMGSGGFIVFDEDQCVVRHTLTLARFYRHESCGQCSPLPRRHWLDGKNTAYNIEYGKGKISDIDLLWDIQRKIEGNTICPLGDAAAWPVAAIGHFRDEFEWHVLNPEECQRRNYGLAYYAMKERL